MVKILSKKDPVHLNLLLHLNLIQPELLRMNIDKLYLLNKTVQVTPEVMRMLGQLLEEEVTRNYSEWAATITSPTVSENVRMKPSRRQPHENERDCLTVFQRLVFSNCFDVNIEQDEGTKYRDSEKDRHFRGDWSTTDSIRVENCVERKVVRGVGLWRTRWTKVWLASSDGWVDHAYQNLSWRHALI